jgi:hypothetical protein
VHLDASCDSSKTCDLIDELGCHAVISAKGTPLQTSGRFGVERANSWHNRGFKKLRICAQHRTRVIEAFTALAGTVIIRRLLRAAWTIHRRGHPATRRP